MHQPWTQLETRQLHKHTQICIRTKKWTHYCVSGMQEDTGNITHADTVILSSRTPQCADTHIEIEKQYLCKEIPVIKGEVAKICF